MLALPRMFLHLDLKKCSVERENEEVKLIEPRDVRPVSDRILAELESVPLSAVQQSEG
jgi:hypothetical protein